MIKVIPANIIQDYLKIEILANSIWRAHYIPMLGKPQTEHMLRKYQSAKAIGEQVLEGFEYFLLHYDEVLVGYMAIKKESDVLFLSKFYILSAYRKKNIGKTALLFVEEKATSYHLKSIRLTVNINNTNSIKIYEKLGFENLGSLVTDIGNGFVMDDYIMVKIPAKAGISSK